MTGFTRLAFSLLVATSIVAAIEVPQSNTQPHVERDAVAVAVPIAHKRRAPRRLADHVDEVTELVPRASNTKAGLAWNSGSGGDKVQKQFWSGVSWCYSWSAWTCSDSKHLEFVPMMWGNTPNAVKSWKSQVMGKKWKNILAFNEPDHKGQAAITPQQAVKLWNQYIKPVNSKRKGAPAVTNSDRGRKWIGDFLKACKGCQIDFVPVHFYGTSVQRFKETVTAIHKISGKPVWITEWACQNFGKPGDKCDSNEVKAFLKATQEWMDKTSWVERYSWFGTLGGMGNVNPVNAMLKNGKITGLGRQYIN